MQRFYKLNWIYFFLMGCFLITLTGCPKGYVSDSQIKTKQKNLRSEVKKMQGSLDLLNAEIDKHEKNKIRIHEILVENIKNKTQPDVSLLKHSATATGDRTEAFYALPEDIQKHIIDFEKPIKPSNVVDGLTLAGLTATYGHGRGSYIMEESRTTQFLGILKKERDKIKEQIDTKKTALTEVNKEYNNRNLDLYEDDDPGCFTADMFVLIEKGGKHIDEIKAGDWVLTSDDAGQITPEEVLEHLIYDNNHYYLINETIKVTGRHRFSTKKGWKRVQNLQIGDEVWTSEKNFRKVESMARISADNKVYCLEMANNHNFFVSHDQKNGYLVHNCGDGGK